MKIPLLDLKAQYNSIKKEIDAALMSVVESQHFILSGEVENLEKEIAAYNGMEHAAGLASGTDALVLALRTLGIGKGDIVVTTPFTFFATAESISSVGATPAFVDIDPKTFNIDPAKLEEYLKSRKSKVDNRVKAVIPVHLYGQCADMTKIMPIAKKYGLKVIEDTAQAIGASHNGKKAGTFGDIGCFSFFPSKNLGGFGDGGMVVSADEELIKHIKRLRVHGSVKQYVHEEIGYNSRLDSLQAAVLRVKLKKLDQWLNERRRIAAVYDGAFGKAGIKFPFVEPYNVHTYHQYTISVPRRDELQKFLDGQGITARVYYPIPLHVQPCYKDLGYKKGDFPLSDKAAETAISLPVYPGLTEENISYVIEKVSGFFSKQ